MLTSKICRFVRRAKSNVPAICLAWSQLVKLDISPCKLSVKKTQTMSILEWIIPVKSSFALFRLKYKIKVEIINACCETDLHYWWNWLRLIITGVRIRLLLNSVCFIRHKMRLISNLWNKSYFQSPKLLKRRLLTMYMKSSAWIKMWSISRKVT